MTVGTQGFRAQWGSINIYWQNTRKITADLRMIVRLWHQEASADPLVGAIAEFSSGEGMQGDYWHEQQVDCVSHTQGTVGTQRCAPEAPLSDSRAKRLRWPEERLRFKRWIFWL